MFHLQPHPACASLLPGDISPEREVIFMLLIHCSELEAIRADEADNAELVETLRRGEFPGLVCVQTLKRKLYLNLSENVPFVVEFRDDSQDVGTARGSRVQSLADVEF
ncbi:hypothetical protein KPHES19104_05940 [Corynebacterium ulcerans]